MNALWLALGVVIGAALMAVALRPRLRGLTVDAARARELEDRLVKTSTELEQERAGRRSSWRRSTMPRRGCRPRSRR